MNVLNKKVHLCQAPVQRNVSKNDMDNFPGDEEMSITGAKAFSC